MKVSKQFQVLASARPYTMEYDPTAPGASYHLHREGVQLRPVVVERLRPSDIVDALNEAWLAGYAKGCADSLPEEDLVVMERREPYESGY